MSSLQTIAVWLSSIITDSDLTSSQHAVLVTAHSGHAPPPSSTVYLSATVRAVEAELAFGCFPGYGLNCLLHLRWCTCDQVVLMHLLFAQSLNNAFPSKQWLYRADQCFHYAVHRWCFWATSLPCMVISLAGKGEVSDDEYYLCQRWLAEFIVLLRCDLKACSSCCNH